jgi:hypothetical protein
MDLANDALAELDLVIGSVHSHMNMEVRRNDRPPAARARMPAPAHPGPPHRPPPAAPRSVPFDFDRVAAEAVRRGVWLEINASPERLDLHGALIRNAKAKGARFTISTDAHHPKQLDYMRYGVSPRAAAGWAERHSEHAAGGPFRRRAPIQTMKITSSREVYRCKLFRVTEDHAVDPRPVSKSSARWCATPVPP